MIKQVIVGTASVYSLLHVSYKLCVFACVPSFKDHVFVYLIGIEHSESSSAINFRVTKNARSRVQFSYKTPMYGFCVVNYVSTSMQ